MTNDELLAKATQFTIWSHPEYKGECHLIVEFRGNGKWAVMKDSAVYSRSTRWFLYERQPSSRTDEMLADTRFTRDEALAIAQDWADKFQAAYERTRDNPRDFIREIQPDRFGVNIEELHP